MPKEQKGKEYFDYSLTLRDFTGFCHGYQEGCHGDCKKCFRPYDTYE